MEVSENRLQMTYPPCYKVFLSVPFVQQAQKQPLFTNAYVCPPPDGQPLHCPPRVRPIAVITPTHDSLRPTLFYRTYVFLNTTFDRRGCPKTTNLSIHGKGASSFLFGKISAFLKNEGIQKSFHAFWHTLMTAAPYVYLS